MKKNDVEKRIREQADALTPEPPSFEAIEKKIDWNQVAASARPNKPSRRFFVPVAIAASALLVVGATVGVIVYQSNQTSYYGEGDGHPVVFGKYIANRWETADDSFDLSLTSVTAQKEKAAGSKGNANLFARDGSFAGSLIFEGLPFSNFSFQPLNKVKGSYSGDAGYGDANYSFSALFSPLGEEKTTLTIRFGSAASAFSGFVEYLLS